MCRSARLDRWFGPVVVDRGHDELQIHGGRDFMRARKDRETRAHLPEGSHHGRRETPH